MCGVTALWKDKNGIIVISTGSAFADPETRENKLDPEKDTEEQIVDDVPDGLKCYDGYLGTEMHWGQPTSSRPSGHIHRGLHTPSPPCTGDLVHIH